MVSDKVVITNPTGIHARPASNLLNFEIGRAHV